MKTLILSISLTFVIFGTLRGENTIEMRGAELAAAAEAVTNFKKIYAKPDLHHYTIKLERRGDLLEVTFVGDAPSKYIKGTAGTGGGSTFGPDMTYVVSLRTLKVVSFNYYR